MKSVRRWVPAVLVAAFSFCAFAAISNVNPGQGSISSEIRMTVTEAGTKKPKVFLTDHNAEGKTKKLPVKVTSFNSETGELVGIIKRGSVGLFDVNVQPKVKGAALQTAPAAIQLVDSTLDSVTPTETDAGDEVTINGADFGTKKGRVRIGGKPAKVLEWTETSIRAKTHKKAGPGLVDIEVRNKIGTSTLEGQLTLTTPPKPIKGKDTLTGKFGNAGFKSTKSVPGLNVILQGVTGTTISAQSLKVSRTGSGTTKTLLMQIDAQTDESIKGGATFNAFTVTYGVSTTKASGRPPNLNIQTTTQAFRLDQSAGFTVTITNRSGDRLQGTFSGTLEEVEDGVPTGKKISANGKFTATLQTIN